MKKKQNTNNFGYFAKAKNFLDNYALFYKIKNEEEEIKIKFNEKYNNFTYLYPFFNVLLNSHLIDDKGNFISFVKCQNSCPDSFSFNSRKNNKSFSFFHSLGQNTFFNSKNKADINNCSSTFINLILSSEGDIIFQYFENGHVCSTTLASNSYELFYNLPLFFSWFLNGNESKENSDRLENFINNNNGSTFSSVYNYVKNNLNEINRMPEYTNNLASAFLDVKKNFTRTVELIYNTFDVDYNDSHSVSYQIKMDKIGNLFVHAKHLGLDPHNSYLNFPVKIAINEDGFIPYFTGSALSKEEKTKLIKGQETPFLLTKEEKYSTLVKDYLDSSKNMREMATRMTDSIENNPSMFGKSSKSISIFPLCENMAKNMDLEARKKSLKIELDNNTKIVINESCRFLNSSKSYKMTKNKQIKINKLKNAIISFEASTNKLSNLFRNIYKNEILIKDL